MLIERSDVLIMGGGTGGPGTIHAAHEAGAHNIIAVPPMFDSGGATGQRRLVNPEEVALSDAMRVLQAMVHPKNRRRESYRKICALLNDRDARNTVLGHEIIYRLFSRDKGFALVEEYMKAFGITLNGHVHPSSTQSSNIEFRTKFNRLHVGEHLLDIHRMSEDEVVSMRLRPEVDAFPPALEEIRKAKKILLAFGSQFGSVNVIALPKGMKEAIADSDAEIWQITNLTSTRNELSHQATPLAYAESTIKYFGRLDGLVTPEMTRKQFEDAHPDVAARYASEYAHFLGRDDDELKRVRGNGIKVVTHKATMIQTVGFGETAETFVRHDAKVLGKETLRKILELENNRFQIIPFLRRLLNAA